MIKRLFLAALLVLSLVGCASIPGGDALNAGVAIVSDALTGPDTDYKNYLSHCSKEVAAQQKAAESDSTALVAALNSTNEKTQFGALILLAVKSGNNSPKIGCSVTRKKSIPELLLTDNSLIDLGKDLYFENRAEKRFRTQLDADNERFRVSSEQERERTRDNNDLIRDIGGTRPDEANRSRREAERLPLPNPPRSPQ